MINIKEHEGKVVWHNLIFIFLFSIVLRLINLVFLDISSAALLIEDAHMYWHQTTEIMRHKEFAVSNNGVLSPITERVPLYYILLSCIRILFGESLLATLIVQSVMDSLSCVLIGMLGTVYSNKAGLISGVLAAISPNLIINSASILTDSLFLFLFTAMLLFLVYFIKTIKLKFLVFSALLLGCAIMTRSVAQFLPFLLSIVIYIVCLINGKSIIKVSCFSLLFLLISILIVSPVLHRNIIEFDTFQLTSQNGTHVAGWVAPLVRQKYDQTPQDVGANELIVKIESEFKLENDKDIDELNAFEKSKVLSSGGLNSLISYPLKSILSAWMEGAVMNLAAPALVIDQRLRELSTLHYYEIQGKNIIERVAKYLINNSKLYTTIVVCMLLLVPISIILKCYGLFILARKYRGIAILTVFYILYFLIINGPVASPKYRLPIEPALIILTAIGILEMYKFKVEKMRLK